MGMLVRFLLYIGADCMRKRVQVLIGHREGLGESTDERIWRVLRCCHCHGGWELDVWRGCGLVSVCP